MPTPSHPQICFHFVYLELRFLQIATPFVTPSKLSESNKVTEVEMVQCLRKILGL